MTSILSRDDFWSEPDREKLNQEEPINWLWDDHRRVKQTKIERRLLNIYAAALWYPPVDIDAPIYIEDQQWL